MRYLKLLSIIIVMAFSSCSDERLDRPFKDVGVITGADLTLCACCGGWFIEISTKRYRFDELPGNSNIDLNSEEYPIQVNLDWILDPNACFKDEIIIERIEKI